MIFLLMGALILLLFILSIGRKFDFLDPVLWIVIGYLLAVLVGILNYPNWGDISALTVLVVLFSVISFIIGSLSGKSLLFGNVKSNVDVQFPHYMTSFMNVIMLITAIMYLQYMIELSYIGGNPGGWQQLFSFARNAVDRGLAPNMDFVLTFLLRLSFAFAHIQTYIVIKKYVFLKHRRFEISELITMILYFSHTIISGGRTKMMYYIVFIFVVYLILFRHKKNWTEKSTFLVIRYLLLALVIGLSIFIVIEQTVRGSIYGTTFNMWNQLSKYMGSSIYALNVYLDNPTFMTNFKETETLFPIISIVNKLGADIPFINNALEFVNFGNDLQVNTNIYTASRRYIHDFGYIGMVVLMFIQGFLYSTIYNSIKFRRIDGVFLIIYGIIIYPAAFYFIEERFLNDLFTLTMIFQLFMIIIIWSFLVGKINFRRN